MSKLANNPCRQQPRRPSADNLLFLEHRDGEGTENGVKSVLNSFALLRLPKLGTLLFALYFQRFHGPLVKMLWKYVSEIDNFEPICLKQKDLTWSFSLFKNVASFHRQTCSFERCIKRNHKLELWML
jgi:hypothetical protein